MQRSWLLIAALVAACGDDAHHLPDARPVDAAHLPDAAGSGSAVASALEASPRDRGLEVVVVVTSMVVVIGPIRSRRRRRDDHDGDDLTPGT